MRASVRTMVVSHALAVLLFMRSIMSASKMLFREDVHA